MDEGQMTKDGRRHSLVFRPQSSVCSEHYNKSGIGGLYAGRKRYVRFLGIPWFFQGRLTEFELYGAPELIERKIHKVGSANQVFARNS